MPTTIQALIILLLVVVPGYIFALTLLKSIANIATSEWRFLLTTLALGAIVHAIMSRWTDRLVRIYDRDPHRLYDYFWEVLGWGAVTILVLPLGLGIGIGWLARTDRGDRLLTRFGFGYISLLPSAWEYIFRKPKGMYLRVHLRDGSVIGGLYSVSSFTANPPGVSDLFIEQVWILDEAGNFIQPIPTNRGAWIAHDIISYIEFLEGETEDANEQRTEASEISGPAEPSAAGHEGQSADDSGEPQAAAQVAEGSDTTPG